jgi:hypothetical protein
MNMAKDALWTEPESCIATVQKELGTSREVASSIVEVLGGCFEDLEAMRRDLVRGSQVPPEQVRKLEDERRLGELIAELQAKGRMDDAARLARLRLNLDSDS